MTTKISIKISVPQDEESSNSTIPNLGQALKDEPCIKDLVDAIQALTKRVEAIENLTKRFDSSMYLQNQNGDILYFDKTGEFYNTIKGSPARDDSGKILHVGMDGIYTSESLTDGYEHVLCNEPISVATAAGGIYLDLLQLAKDMQS